MLWGKGPEERIQRQLRPGAYLQGVDHLRRKTDKLTVTTTKYSKL